MEQPVENWTNNPKYITGQKIVIDYWINKSLVNYKLSIIRIYFDKTTLEV
jgi:hypothetical protein